MSRFAIGVDLGGTNLRAAAITAEGEELEEFSIPTASEDGPERVVERIAAGIREVEEGHSGKDLIGIGVGVPGLVRVETGVIAKAPNLKGWENFALKALIEEKINRPVIVENDANCAALGEIWLGAGKDVDDLILLTLGTGIGGGIIYQGRVVHGYLGMAGEFGHMTVNSDSPHRCGCGNFGCMEAEASGTAIRNMAAAAVAAGRAATLRELSAARGEITPLLVAEAAVGGDAESRRIYDYMGRALGVGLGNLINAFNFPLYLLAGGILASWDLFSPAMFEEVRKRSVTYRNSDTRIEKAALGNQSGIYGAAYLPIQQECGS